MSAEPTLLGLLSRLEREQVEYVLVGGQAVRLNGYVRATDDIDLLVRATRENGERLIRALGFLAASTELDAGWFVPGADGEVENIRIADELLIDLLFSANGETYESVQPFVRDLEIEGTRVRVLDIDGLLRTKTDYRERDVLDRQVLSRIKRSLESRADTSDR